MISFIVIAVLAQKPCTPELWCGNELPECVTPLARELFTATPSPKLVARSEEVLRTETDPTTRIVAMRILANARRQSLEAHALKLAQETHDCRFEGIELLASVPSWSPETRAFIEHGLRSDKPHAFFKTISAREEPWVREFLLGELRSPNISRRLAAMHTFKSQVPELREAANFVGMCDSSLEARELAKKALKILKNVKCPPSAWRVEDGAVTNGSTRVKLVMARQEPGVEIVGETANWSRDGGVMRGLRYLPLGVMQRGEQTLVLGSRGGMLGAVGELRGNSIEWLYDVPTLPTAWATNGEQVFVEMEANAMSSPLPARSGARVVHVFERDGGVLLVK